MHSAQAGDDRVGGAVITGTVTSFNVPGRLANSAAQEILLQQGLESMQVYRAQLKPIRTVVEGDTVILTAPSNHLLLGQSFRVINVRVPSFWDNRRFIQVTLSRIIKSRSQQH